MSVRQWIRLAVAVAGIVALPAPAGALAAASPTLSPGVSERFPTKSFVLTLPEKQVLKRGDVEVTENGEPVGRLTVSSSAVTGSSVVLVIDASLSVHGQAIADAMTAARSFAERRRPDQKLGVVFFSNEPVVALTPTTDQARIDEVLGSTPQLSKGTRIFDAAVSALDLLKRTDASLSSVVLMTDGADTGSAVTPDGVVADAEKQRVRLHVVGVRSARFDPAPLRRLAGAGSYTEAESSAQLDRIFSSLGDRLSNEYVLRYRSEAPLESRVAVTATIAGIRRSAVTTYETPALDVKLFDPESNAGSSWAGPRATAAIAALIGVLLGFALLMLVRPRRRSVGERVAGFVGTVAVVLEEPERQPAPPTPVLQKVDASLEGKRWWTNFVLDLELAKVRAPAIRVALITVAGAAALGAAFVLLDRPVVAVLMLFVVPAVVRVVPAFRAGRVRRAFDIQLPDNLQVLAAALRAGHSFTGALSVMASDAAEPSRSEFRRVVGDDQLGVAIEESMAVIGERMRNEDVGYIGLVATIQRETGGNTAEVLDRVTGTIRERAQLRRLVRTLTAQGRLGGWIVTCLPIGVLTFLTLVQPSYLEPMLEDPLGRVALILGALMLIAGAFVIRRVVDIKV
jgi:tight adherence protein B